MTEPLPDGPTDDPRWPVVEAELARVGYAADGLIEVLHVVQEGFGYLDRTALAAVAAALGLPLSRVYGVATFYSFFTLAPGGAHTCIVCTGTACYIAGANRILERLSGELGVGAGGTTEDGKLSVVAARCTGTCSLAPLVVVDDEVVGWVDPDGVMARLDAL